ncbi:MAG: undecaprenyl/decaprenyl-phosphate alpha-N-acetylglucosaminyl 1-phosphate transferase [Elusimicrobiaceae bacterium]|nr:undecaprenyl/decaprenyl-phosphate alpha-N-acetylglucosaminyl 1-phosphate transferase [Elusimicrobiaceae bacterium]
MDYQTQVFFALTFALSFVLTFILIPVFCRSLGKYLKDIPTALKNHEGIVPLVGGISIMFGFLASLTVIRFITNFPTGTLHNLRGIFLGVVIIFILGLIDDIRKPKGLSAVVRLIFQALAAGCLIYFNVKIQFVPEPWGTILTVLWVCGLTNAFNLLDIQDGLATSQTLLASLAFLFISLPSENIYVNFLACAITGATLAFWPYNHGLGKIKSFLGDSGSTMLGFVLSALALGVDYSAQNPLAVFAPLLILALPIFDTIYVSIVRLSKHMSPLHGSPDHVALRLFRRGLTKKQVLLYLFLGALILDVLAYTVTKSNLMVTVVIYLFVFIFITVFASFLREKVK